MSSRSAFYDGVLPVDYWNVTAPPGSPLDGDICLLASSGCTGAFFGQDRALAFYNAASSSWRFQAASGSPGLRGVLLFNKMTNLYYGHDGTIPFGPFATLPSPASGTWLSGNGTSWIAANLPALFSVFFTNGTALAVNTPLYGIGNVSMVGTLNEGIAIPSGKTLVITEVFLNVRAGSSTPGTYTVDLIVVDGPSTGQTVLVTGATSTLAAWIQATAKNIATGLFALAGPSSLRIGWKNRASSPAALTGANGASVMASGVFL